jgi:putative NADPH-quinone reductase
MSKALIIFCHPCLKSLNFYLKSLIKEKLEKNLFEVKETQIYEHLEKISNNTLSFYEEEREKIRESDLIVLQFPVYFENFPALLQMFWVKVLEGLSNGLTGKKVLVSCTLGGRHQDYCEEGGRDSLEGSLGELFQIVFKGSELLQPLCLFKDEYSNTELFHKKLQKISFFLERISEWPKKYQNLEFGLD